MRACVRACVFGLPAINQRRQLPFETRNLLDRSHFPPLPSVGGERALRVEKARLQRNKKTRERNDDTSWKCQRFDRTGTVVSRARRPRSASRQMENIDFQ